MVAVNPWLDGTFGFAPEYDNVKRAANDDGVESGMTPTQRAAGVNMSIDVSAGYYRINNVRYTYAGGNQAVNAAHATLPRWDIVYFTSAGIQYTAGTAATYPLMPTLPASSILIAAVYVAANDTAITDDEIRDEGISLHNYKVFDSSTGNNPDITYYGRSSDASSGVVEGATQCNNGRLETYNSTDAAFCSSLRMLAEDTSYIAVPGNGSSSKTLSVTPSKQMRIVVVVGGYNSGAGTVGVVSVNGTTVATVSTGGAGSKVQCVVIELAQLTGTTWYWATHDHLAGADRVNGGGVTVASPMNVVATGISTTAGQTRFIGNFTVWGD